MAKQLILIRHAKSDWGNVDLTDFNRPLNKRGLQNAPEMADRLVKQQIVPDLIVSSPAVRALTTAKYFAEAWHIEHSAIQEEGAIYEANVRSLLAVINHLNNDFQKVALFGHNPGLTDLVSYLDGHMNNMPTCGVVVLSFPFDNWNEISADTGKILLFDYPKNGDD